MPTIFRPLPKQLALQHQLLAALCLLKLHSSVFLLLAVELLSADFYTWDTSHCPAATLWRHGFGNDNSSAASSKHQQLILRKRLQLLLQMLV